jgi:hypothetical protein
MRNGKQLLRGILLISGIALLSLDAGASQQFWKRKKKADKKVIEKKYESKLDSITDGAVKDEGMFTVYKKKTDYYFQFPLDLQNRDFLIVNKISGVPANLNESGINKGMNYENIVIQFKLNKELNKLFVMQHRPFVDVPEDDMIALSVKDNFASSILESFKISGYSKDSTSVIIKVNKIYDGSVKSFNNVFGMTGLGTSPNKDFSFIKQIKSFPGNIVAKSYQTTKIPGAETKANLTVEVTSNLVLLPKVPMTPRFLDQRVGYFSVDRWYFNDEQHKLDKRELVTRWRLEPKDKEAYLRGELVEPIKPIVFYIDPSTPPKWRQYIIDGVKDWQVAFEQAGFKNAITCYDAPTNDPDFDLDDVRYSVITYVASDKANAMGPSVFDPRSGEIIEADVVWWHNVLTAVHSWIRVQTGIIDEKARGNRFSDKHMGEAVRFISSHELGHTLGLQHNMGASYAYSVESLRSPEFTKKMATAPSIMDYARFNYVAQPGDNVKNITPKIGVYDKYAIEWAYRYYDIKDAFEDQKEALKVIEKHVSDVNCRFVGQQGMRNGIDPRAQSEDLGDNSMIASEYGLKNLRRIMPEILNWSAHKGESYRDAGELLNAVIGQWHTYSYHVLTNVGGVYINNTVYGDGQETYEYVSKAKQKQAISYLNKNVFNCPKWLFKNDIYSKIYPTKESPNGPREYNPFALLKNYQSYIYWDLLTDDRINRMIANEAFNGNSAYKASEMMNDLHKGIFAPTIKGRKLDLYQRASQKAFIDALIVAVDKNAVSKTKKRLTDNSISLNIERLYNGPKRVSDAVSLKRGELIRIENLFKKRVNNSDIDTKYHYADILLRINHALRN